MKAAIGIEPMNKAFAELCLTTWLRRLEIKLGSRPIGELPNEKNGAGDEGRTRDFDLGKVALYH